MHLIEQFLIERTDSEIAMFFSFDVKTTTKGVRKFGSVCFIILLDRYSMKNTTFNQVL